MTLTKHSVNVLALAGYPASVELMPTNLLRRWPSIKRLQFAGSSQPVCSQSAMLSSRVHTIESSLLVLTQTAKQFPLSRTHLLIQPEYVSIKYDTSGAMQSGCRAGVADAGPPARPHCAIDLFGCTSPPSQ